MESLAYIVFEWGERCFGRAHMTDKRVRSMRLLEEAIELAQALEVEEAEAVALVKYVYRRPPGKVVQELGGVAVCLSVLCTAFGTRIEEMLLKETLRVLASDSQHFAERNQEKIAAGFK